MQRREKETEGLMAFIQEEENRDQPCKWRSEVKAYIDISLERYLDKKGGRFKKKKGR